MKIFKKFSIVAMVLAIATAGMSLPIKAATAEKKPLSQIVIQNVNIFDGVSEELVRVRLLDDPKGQSLYVPVQISGLLRVEASDATIFILDGEARMLSGWTLYANTVDRREDLGGRRRGLVQDTGDTIMLHK